MKKALFFIMCALLLTACTGYNNSTSLTENGFYYHISSNGKEAIVAYYEWDGTEDTAVITIPNTLSNGATVNSLGGFIGIGVPVNFNIKYKFDWPELPKSSKTMSEEEIEAFYRDYADEHPDELFGHLVKLDTLVGDAASGSAVSADNGEGNEVAGSEGSSESIDPEKVVYKDITFTINIGKNISKTGPYMLEYGIFHEINQYGIERPDGSILVYRPSLYYNVDPENTTFYAEDGVLYRTADGKPVAEDKSE